MMTKTNNIRYILFLILLIAFTLASRFISIDGVPQFNALLASAAFMGFIIPSRKWLVVTVLLMMVVSDFVLGNYALDLSMINYAAVVSVCLMAHALGKYNFKNSSIAALLAPVLFFLISNAGVWITTSYYSHDLSGLIQCYAMGLPFAKGTVIGSLLYSALFYFSYQNIFKSALIPQKSI